jgi:hypothetical protein
MQTAASTSLAEYAPKPSAQYEKTLLKKGLSGMCTISRAMRSMELIHSYIRLIEG